MAIGRPEHRGWFTTPGRRRRRAKRAEGQLLDEIGGIQPKPPREEGGGAVSVTPIRGSFSDARRAGCSWSARMRKVGPKKSRSTAPDQPAPARASAERSRGRANQAERDTTTEWWQCRHGSAIQGRIGNVNYGHASLWEAVPAWPLARPLCGCAASGGAVAKAAAVARRRLRPSGPTMVHQCADPGPPPTAINDGNGLAAGFSI